MSPKEEEEERNEEVSDVFEFIEKQFTFLADSIGMNSWRSPKRKPTTAKRVINSQEKQKLHQKMES